METILLLVALTGGYFFSVTCPPSSFKAAGESGHKIYFRSVFYTALLAPVAFLALIDLGLYCTNLDLLEAISTASKSTSFTAFLIELADSQRNRYFIYITIFLLGAFAPWLPILILRIFPSLEERIKLQSVKENDFELLVFKSLKREIPILVTLISGKVYAGWAVKTPNPKAARRHLTVLPLLSGYRSPTQHRVEFTTNYYDILERLRNGPDPDLNYMYTEDLQVVIPTDQISSAHLFDLTVYEQFQKRSA
jgi:hypothetical protein